jgi:hypothetical protein
VTAVFSKALLLDLIGVPEFCLGLYMAGHFLARVPNWRRSITTAVLFALCFIATGIYGMALRYLLFHEVMPSFLSFAFGMHVLSNEPRE